MVIARTIKGKGFKEIENKEGWHGKALPPDLAEQAIAELGGERDLRIDVRPPDGARIRVGEAADAAVTLPTYAIGDKVATRKAYGDTLRALGARHDVVALDGEVSNSTHADEFKSCVSGSVLRDVHRRAADGRERGRVSRCAATCPFASTFAAFFSRAYDFIRMAGVSEVSIRLSGSHAGCEIGADGPSQMALEDLASMRAVHTSTVLYPSDAVSAAKLVAQMADLDGISYIRTTRGAYPVLYDNDEAVPDRRLEGAPHERPTTS